MPADTPSFSLAHLSDPHLSDLHGVRVRQLLNKRILGYLSWRRRRRLMHRREILEQIQADLLAQAPDHIAVVGDLTHIGLPSEFQQGLTWLRSLGDPEHVSVIPGNHETYTSTPRQQTLDLWRPYMDSDRPTSPAFPSLRIRGPAALIGLNSALPTAPFLATGQLGASQIQALETILATTAEQGLFRVVMIHHPPGPRMTHWRKRLTDAPALAAALARQGAEMVIYGHTHRLHVSRLSSRLGPIPVFGGPSASARDPRPDHDPGYLLYQIRGDKTGWDLNARARIQNHPDAPLKTTINEHFRLPIHA